VLYLYAWTITVAGLAVALRFIPYSDDRGHLDPGWSALMLVCFAIALAASVYLVYVLEILKLRRLRAWQLRKEDPDTSEHEIDERFEEELETGEFAAVAVTRGGVNRTDGVQGVRYRRRRPAVRPPGGEQET